MISSLAGLLTLVPVKGVLYKKDVFFCKKNSVEQFWDHVKGLCTLTSKMSISRSYVTIVNE